MPLTLLLRVNMPRLTYSTDGWADIHLGVAMATWVFHCFWTNESASVFVKSICETQQCKSHDALNIIYEKRIKLNYIWH